VDRLDRMDRELRAADSKDLAETGAVIRRVRTIGRGVIADLDALNPRDDSVRAIARDYAAQLRRLDTEYLPLLERTGDAVAKVAAAKDGYTAALKSCHDDPMQCSNKESAADQRVAVAQKEFHTLDAEAAAKAKEFAPGERSLNERLHVECGRPEREKGDAGL